MSTFNTHKDRNRHGKPLPHWRVQYATHYRIKHIHCIVRYGDNAPRVNHGINPRLWNSFLYMTRRRRIDDRALAYAVVTGEDSDSLLWYRTIGPWNITGKPQTRCSGFFIPRLTLPLIEVVSSRYWL